MKTSVQSNDKQHCADDRNAGHGTSKSAAKKTRRRWPRYSVRMLLVIMTGLSIWMGLATNSARRQKRAVEVLVGLGVSVVYDFQEQSDLRGLTTAKMPGPAWLHGILGDHYFITPVTIHIRDQRVIDENGLKVLRDLPRVRSLWFGDVKLRTTDLSYLQPLNQLQTLVFGDDTLPVQSGRGGLKVLKRYPKLQVLQIEGNGLTDRDLAFLSNAEQLEALTLYETSIGDLGLAHISQLTNLKSLGLSQTKVTDYGLIHLRGLNKLTYLSLNYCKITDKGLEHLPSLSKLATIALYGTGVTALGG